ncbi:hypothetical protein B0H21DRAFT_112035 [Amylocystis lapponica]|nr:hypothetical protein B0H21DRAFT_112035 [Amylocystis lapponica]
MSRHHPGRHRRRHFAVRGRVSPQHSKIGLPMIRVLLILHTYHYPLRSRSLCFLQSIFTIFFLWLVILAVVYYTFILLHLLHDYNAHCTTLITPYICEPSYGTPMPMFYCTLHLLVYINAYA